MNIHGALATIAGYVIALLLVPRILAAHKDSGATLAWLIVIVLFPYVGALVYLLIGATTVRRKSRRKRRSDEKLEPELGRLAAPLQQFDVDEATAVHPDQRPLMRLAADLADCPPLAGNDVRLLVDPAARNAALEGAIANARHHVHLEYYLFRPDETGRRYLALLEEKARQGVEVRLLYDSVGSVWLTSSVLRRLRAAGGKAFPFLPVHPLRRPFRANFRNHRKIAVIDGEVAFTGGANIGDEYAGIVRRRFAPWRDTHSQISGPAVHLLQEVFAEDWYFATGEDLSRDAYFPPQSRRGDALVQVVASGPDSSNEIIHRLFFSAITTARERVWLTTPYFIPDRALLVALETAAMRGVDVRILVPRRCNHILIGAAARTFFADLTAAGCKVYEYEAGMLHAKTLVVDGRWSTVGSANMDMRSFRLNWEVNVVVCGEAFAAELERVFLADVQKARIAETGRRGLGRLADDFCRVLAPVL